MTHDFASADTALNGKLLPTAARLCEGLDQALDEARGVVACCGVRHVSGLGRAFVYAIATAVAFTVVFVGAMLLAVASGRKRRSLGDLGLPTYGMTPYNSRPSSVLGSFSRPSSRSQNYHL
ncbi:hypothetical protein MNEG_14225 [Monoraphidium neglectum]|uniref:Uncharacterized protein n=1 Tax=Monoraphidium neglectum TaxID=145388 RepID=A0A0D2KD73_9CHLO|nr:hypothetical protein MNEG_14225 [Monoraphidium neglectum]KIY93738.1 hypothetical protein MNEG_14225 [Monoraphidium neglectum]|eukprot:XP_013892758.1 hypothetical protein MNEG_14225 [Monoraphidium neglectum]